MNRILMSRHTAPSGRSLWSAGAVRCTKRYLRSRFYLRSFFSTCCALFESLALSNEK